MEVQKEKREKKEKKEKKVKKDKKEAKEEKEQELDPQEQKSKKKRGFVLLNALDEKNDKGDEKTAIQKDDDHDHDDEKQTSKDVNEEGANRKRKRNRTRKKKTPKEEDGDDTTNQTTDLKGALVEGTIYVEGISYDADDSDIMTFFEQVGHVTSVRMPRWHDSNKPRGYAHVVFEDSKHVPIAIKQLNNQRLMGRYLKVALPNTPKVVGGGPKSAPPEGCRTVFVKNLPYDCNEQAVRDVMSEFGVVKDVRLAIANSTGENQRLKGFGYVQFASEVSVSKAATAASNGSLKLGGRSLYLDFDIDAKPKGSFRRTDGTLWKETETR